MLFIHKNQNKEELADTKGVNRIRKSKKNRQLSDQRNNILIKLFVIFVALVRNEYQFDPYKGNKSCKKRECLECFQMQLLIF